MERTAKHVIFRGHVQGVGFRYAASRIARRYDVTGFVRNLPDGTVEMLVQGPTGDVDNCLAEISEYFGGGIHDSRTKQTPYNPAYHDFQITQ